MTLSPLDPLRQRENVAPALFEGATLIATPYIPTDGALERVNLSIERGLRRAIDAGKRAG
ncbi:hypothetical protein [Paracoccus sp. MKU1]|uniref:hypothetical protein n=1 Tax=Paracoccus sp. MKU1 TaxID=1745182 RepID=UPI000B046C40|nr:hypothetical protein [Paracoccus sp. MKU1]